MAQEPRLSTRITAWIGGAWEERLHPHPGIWIKRPDCRSSPTTKVSPGLGFPLSSTVDRFLRVDDVNSLDHTASWPSSSNFHNCCINQDRKDKRKVKNFTSHKWFAARPSRPLAGPYQAVVWEATHAFPQHWWGMPQCMFHHPEEELPTQHQRPQRLLVQLDPHSFRLHLQFTEFRPLPCRLTSPRGVTIQRAPYRGSRNLL